MVALCARVGDPPTIITINKNPPQCGGFLFSFQFAIIKL